MFLHLRANDTDQKKQPQKINIHVITSQYEIAEKITFAKLRLHPPEHNLPTTEELTGKSSILA